MENAEIKTTQTSLGGGRIGYIDALRCFAILFVIEGHVWAFGMGIGSYDTLSGLMLYTFDLPLFFYISGFLAYKPKMTFKDVGRELIKKFNLLFIPAVAFSVFYNLLSHKSILTPLFQGFGMYWFTISLFECFLIYYVVQITTQNPRLKTILMVLLAIIGIVLLSVYSEFGPKVIDFNHLCKYFYFFVIGLMARKYQHVFDKLVHSELFKGIILIAFFLLLFVIDCQFWPQPVFHLVRDIVLRVVGTAIVVCLFVTHSSFFERKSKINTIINEIGKKSLAIYLLQYFFIPDFTAYSEWLNGMDEFTIHLVSIIYTVFITATCFCFIYLFEQSKFVKRYFLGIK